MTGPGLAGAQPGAGPRAIALAAGASLLLHGGLFVALVFVRGPVDHRATPVDVELVEVPKPPPPAPPPPPEPPAPPARPAPAARPPRVAKAPAPREAPPPAPPPPANAPPPPSNAPAAPGPRQPPVRYGVSMSSTTTAGGFAAPVGNSAYGAPPATAPDPASVQPYRGPEQYTPLAQVTTQPSCTCDIPRAEYPPEALKAEREGQVRLRLLLDAQGRVQGATVLADPGFGFGEAARRVVGRHCRCKPATRDGAPVTTEFPFTVTFVLP